MINADLCVEIFIELRQDRIGLYFITLSIQN